MDIWLKNNLFYKLHLGKNSEVKEDGEILFLWRFGRAFAH